MPRFFQYIWLALNPPLHRDATIVPPLSDQKMVRKLSGRPNQKFCFCVTAAARPVCLPWTTKSAVMEQQVAQRRQSGHRTIAKVAQGLPWSPNGGTMGATVNAQWTLLVGQRRHSGGTRKTEASLKLIHNVHNSRHVLRGDQWPTTVHPFCDHGDHGVRAWRCLNVLCTTFERPRQPLGPLSAFNADGDLGIISLRSELAFKAS